ncbi:MAG: hypothetical protein JKY31_07145 [Rhodobacteraceae bacterium]|nr:hypothetical protein [Paracoccaceae bacterium]
MFKKYLIGAVVALVMPTLTIAQEIEMVDSATDWSVYVTESPKECFIISKPTQSSARRDGNAVDVRRGDIRFYITIIPGEQIISEPSFLAGYPLRQDAPVEFRVGDTTMSLYPNGEIDREYAWPRPDDDGALIAAMRGGSEAIVVGLSTRGTETTDTFSLIGFTAAIEKALELCQ